MITINEQGKSVAITDSDGDMVKIDGNEYQLVDGGISIVNLPSFYDVEVYKKLEENHIERPIIEEPIQIVPEEPIEPPQAPQEP